MAFITVSATAEVYDRPCALYKYTNRVNGKRYWGISVDPVRRKSQHYRASKNNPKNLPKFYGSVNKYGWDNFDYELVVWCRNSYIAGCLEQIAKISGVAELNVTLGGQTGNLGRKFTRTEEQCRAISERLQGNKHRLGIPHPEEDRIKISEALNSHYASPIGDCTRQKISEGLKSTYASEQGPLLRENASKTSKTRWNNDDGQAKKALSRTLIENYASPKGDAIKAKISESLSHHYASPEGKTTKEKISQSLLQGYATEEGEKRKARISQSLTDHYSSPEGQATKQLISQRVRQALEERGEEMNRKRKESQAKWWSSPEGMAHKAKIGARMSARHAAAREAKKAGS